VRLAGDWGKPDHPPHDNCGAPSGLLYPEYESPAANIAEKIKIF